MTPSLWKVGPSVTKGELKVVPYYKENTIITVVMIFPYEIANSLMGTSLGVILGSYVATCHQSGIHTQLLHTHIYSYVRLVLFNYSLQWCP